MKKYLPNSEEAHQRSKQGAITATEKGKKILPKGFKKVLKQTIERRLKVAEGSCVMSVRSVTTHVLNKLGVRKTNQPNDLPIWVMRSAYLLTAEMMEQYGGKNCKKIQIYRGSMTQKKNSNSPAMRVYKFDKMP